MILEPPIGCDQQVFGRLAHEPVDNDVFSEVLKTFADELDVFRRRLDMKRVRRVFLCQFCSLDDLQLVKF